MLVQLLESKLEAQRKSYELIIDRLKQKLSAAQAKRTGNILQNN